MNVIKDKVVSLHYTLRDSDGNILDTTDGREPLEYLHGHQNIIPGLEQALEGALLGFKEMVTVPPDQAYGEVDASARFEIPRSKLPEGFEPEVGMTLVGEANGESYKLTVAEVGAENIVLDGNHPLAGETLHFDVQVVDVREATDQEKVQGYPTPKME